jgi:hypothetical protein
MTSREDLSTRLLVAMASSPTHMAMTPREMVDRATQLADLMLQELARRPGRPPFTMPPPAF